MCVRVCTYSRADTGIPGRVPGVGGSNRTIVRNRSRNKYARMRYGARIVLLEIASLARMGTLSSLCDISQISSVFREV